MKWIDNAECGISHGAGPDGKVRASIYCESSLWTAYYGDSRVGKFIDLESAKVAAVLRYQESSRQRPWWKKFG